MGTKPLKLSFRGKAPGSWGARQGDHLSGKPGNVRKFDSCQGTIRDFTKSQRNFREVSQKNLVREKCLKLFIVSCI